MGPLNGERASARPGAARGKALRVVRARNARLEGTVLGWESPGRMLGGWALGFVRTVCSRALANASLAGLGRQRPDILINHVFLKKKISRISSKERRAAYTNLSSSYFILKPIPVR